MPDQTDLGFPSLFPDSLTDICINKILKNLLTCGARVEHAAEKRLLCDEDTSSSDYETYSQDISSITSHTSLLHSDLPRFLHTNPSPRTRRSSFTQTDLFHEKVSQVRSFLSSLLAGPVLDKLSSSCRLHITASTPGHIFTFSVLCNPRLTRLAVHLHSDSSLARARHWASFLSSPAGHLLGLNCLSSCLNLSSLYLHHVATNEMLYVISDSCHRLQILDISYSSQVTDIGLVHLCGVLRGPQIPHCSAPGGCKYLRELYFNPQSEREGNIIMPRVIACLLRHLTYLQVADLCNLHPGILHYYRGSSDLSYQHRQHRVAPLQLVHYTGSDELAEVMDICPKLRTFKLFVTSSLPSLGTTLAHHSNSLDHVTLVYPPHHQALVGLQQFLAACGGRINQLEVECSPQCVVSLADLASIATHCPQIDSLAFSNFHVGEGEFDQRVLPSPVPTKPANFTFLTSLKLANVQISSHGKEIFCYLLGGARDLETVFISFKSSAFFFSDFLLDDIIALNPLAHLQEFILRGGSLTLISALRLISSRPKLHTVGRLLHWDVEPSELTTFIQILRKAKSLGLLQDISII